MIGTIESNQVTIVQGATGSGKTTQVPQYILDNYAKMGRYCNIIVTQPRRIAAMSIARRVCSERKWQLGTICGYQVEIVNRSWKMRKLRTIFSMLYIYFSSYKKKRGREIKYLMLIIRSYHVLKKRLCCRI